VQHKIRTAPQQTLSVFVKNKSGRPSRIGD
jgi:hypothetical protein